MKYAAYFAMLLIAGGACAFACVIYALSPVALWDSNIGVFKKLNEAEQRGVEAIVHELLTFAILLLVGTNILWAVGVGVALLKARKAACRAGSIA